MGYKTNLKSKQVEENNKQRFEIIDNRFVFSNKLDLLLEENSSLLTIPNYTIKNSDGLEYFRCTYNAAGIVVYSCYNELLCSVSKSPFSSKYAREIYKEELREVLSKPISTIKYKDSLSGNKFLVDFTNMITEKEETFDMNCDLKYNVCGIFYGKEKNGSPMLAKFVKNLYYINTIKIEIAPEVDAAFIIALATYFMKKGFENVNLPRAYVNNYEQELNLKPLEGPIQPLPIVNPDYLLEKPSIYTLVKLKRKSDDLFNITGVDKEILYTVEEDFDSYNINDNQKNTIISVHEVSDSVNVLKFFLGKRREKAIGGLFKIDSNTMYKYRLEYVKKDTDTVGNFIMNSDFNFFHCAILYDNGDGHISLVCKILRDQYDKQNYSVEIAPGIDHVYMLAAAISFAINFNIDID